MHEASSGQETNPTGEKIYNTVKQPLKERQDNGRKNSTTRFMETNPADTVDIMFESISYKVSLGCRKGQFPDTFDKLYAISCSTTKASFCISVKGFWLFLNVQPRSLHNFFSITKSYPGLFFQVRRKYCTESMEDFQRNT